MHSFNGSRIDNGPRVGAVWWWWDRGQRSPCPGLRMAPWSGAEKRRLGHCHRDPGTCGTDTRGVRIQELHFVTGDGHGHCSPCSSVQMHLDGKIPVTSDWSKIMSIWRWRDTLQCPVKKSYWRQEKQTGATEIMFNHFHIMNLSLNIKNLRKNKWK